MATHKKILFMVGGNYVAGAEITNLNLIRDLHLQGYEVLVVVSGWNDGDFIQRLSKHQIPFKSIKLGFIYMRKPLWTLDTLFHYPKAYLQLKKVLRTFQPDWIFHATYRSFLMGYPLFIAYKNVYREHNDPMLSQANIKLYRFLAKKLTKFICPSETVKATLIRLSVNPTRITIIPSPLDPEFTNHTPVPNAAHQTLNVGIIGQIIPDKGFDFLFNEIDKIDTSFNFLIFGDDSTRYAQEIKSKLSAELNKRTKWMGFVKNRLNIYNELDIVIFPSKSESFGRIIIEAGAFGLPTVASDLSCFKEIIQHGETGFMFKLSDTSELSIYVEKLLLDPSLRSKMGQNAKTYVLANFTSEQCTAKFTALIND